MQSPELVKEASFSMKVGTLKELPSTPHSTNRPLMRQGLADITNLSPHISGVHSIKDPMLLKGCSPQESQYQTSASVPSRTKNNISLFPDPSALANSTEILNTGKEFPPVETQDTSRPAQWDVADLRILIDERALKRSNGMELEENYDCVPDLPDPLEYISAYPVL